MENADVQDKGEEGQWRNTKTGEVEGKGNILVSETKTTSRATIPAAETTSSSSAAEAAPTSTAAWPASKLNMNSAVGKKRKAIS